MHVSFHARVLGRYSVPYSALLLAVAGTSLTTVLLHHPSFYRRVHKVRWPAVLVAAAAATLLVAAEIAMRVFDPLGISNYEETSRLWLDYVPDPLLVFRLPAHMRGTYQGVTISTKCARVPGSASSNANRTESVASCFSEIQSPSATASPPKRPTGRKLEGILASRLGRRVRTVNAGIGGFNTVQEYALLEHEASAIDPDIVALMYLPNDINSNDPPFDPRSGIYADTSTVSHFFQEKKLGSSAARRFRDPRNPRRAALHRLVWTPAARRLP